LTDLTDKVKPLAHEFPGYKIANNTGSDGKIYGLPIDSGPCALYYQVDLAEKAGIDPDVDFATYDSWLASSAKYENAGGYLHWMTELGSSGLAFMLVQQQGQSVFDENGNAQLNTTEFINAVTLIRDLYKTGNTGDLAEWTPQLNDAVVNNQVGTLLAAAWYMNVFIHSFQDAENWRIVPMPTFPGSNSKTSNAGGSEMVIPLAAENPEGGWEFIRFYCADVEGRKIGMEALGEFPAYLPLYKESDVQNKTSKFFGDQKVFSFFASLLPDVPDWRTPPALMAVRDMVGAEFPKVMAEEMDPAAFASYVQGLAEVIVKDFD